MHYLYIFYHIPIKRIKRNCVRKFRKISSKASRKQKKKEKSISNPKSKETTRKTVSENRSKRTPTPGIHAHSTLSKPNRVMHAHPFIKNKLQKRDVHARARGANGTQRNVEPFHEYSGMPKAHRESRVTLERLEARSASLIEVARAIDLGLTSFCGIIDLSRRGFRPRRRCFAGVTGACT